MNRFSALIVRFCLLALCVVNLVILGQRLSPLSSLLNVDSQVASTYDPIVCLAVYTLVMFWAGGIRSEGFAKAVRISSILGAVAGLLLIAHITLPSLPDRTHVLMHIGILVGSAILWTASCILGSKAAGHFGVGIVSGIWSAMVSALFASGMILWKMSPDVIGSPFQSHTVFAVVLNSPPAMSLAYGLSASTGYLLICPLAGLVLGLICAVGLE